MTIDYDYGQFPEIEAVIVMVISHSQTTIKRLNSSTINNLLFLRQN